MASNKIIRRGTCEFEINDGFYTIRDFVTNVVGDNEMANTEKKFDKKNMINKSEKEALKLLIAGIAANIRQRGTCESEINAGLYSIRDFLESMEVEPDNSITW